VIPELHLSRLILNSRSRQVQRDLGNCQALHRTIMSGFGDVDGGRAAVSALFRLDIDRRTGSMRVLVQSARCPRWAFADDYLLDPPEVKRIEGAINGIVEGRELVFLLVANPTRKITKLTSAGMPTKNGTRVPIRSEEGRAVWLHRQGAAAGVEVLLARSQPEAFGIPGRGWKPAASDDRMLKLTLDGVRFTGRLRVADPERFRHAVLTGIGPGKAYGYGLLSPALG
jgi:CRISPR system Cascade subunit CasE